MQRFGVEENRSFLERAYEEDVRKELPNRLRKTAENVLHRIGFGKDATADWPCRFSPMVLHYPALQTSAYSAVAVEQAQEANLAHLYLLIFSVLDDRRRDGQVKMSDAEVELTAWLFQRSLSILGRFTVDETLKELANFVCRKYEMGHVRRRLDTSDGVIPACLEVDPVVVGRSYWGVLSTLALLVSSGYDEETVAMATDAFEPLVMGLQWADDLTDWEEDLDSGDDNLLLLALREEGIDPYASSVTDLRKAEVGRFLLERNAFPRAEKLADRWFVDAMNLQRNLRCADIVHLIGKRRGSLGKLRRDVAMKAELDALAQLSTIKILTEG